MSGRQLASLCAARSKGYYLGNGDNECRLKVPALGRADALKELTMLLYVNDWTPGKTDRVTDYVAATFPGFKPWPLLLWTYPYLADGGERR